jgi:hypothetical protein
MGVLYRAGVELTDGKVETVREELGRCARIGENW